MNRSSCITIMCLAGLFAPRTAMACLWDYDTLKMERSRFPEALELITGKFLRHSPEFYQWRVDDRLKKLEQDPKNLAWLDDLAVAYEKLGQHDKAIETILRKDSIQPGLYETEANLGTFLIHAGRLEEGLIHVRRAIEINPDAHFGREKTQAQLVEYVLSRRKNGKIPSPLMIADNGERISFADFLAGQSSERHLSEEGRQAAIKGVLGMMRFGNYDSPVLLEALGSLVKGRSGSLLATRAYLKASQEANAAEAKEAYRELARAAVGFKAHPSTEAQIGLEEVEADYQKEMLDADAWYAALRKDEQSWIATGKNPEQEFDRLYLTAPDLVDTSESYSWGRSLHTAGIVAIVVFAAGFALGTSYLIRKARRALRPS